MEHGPIELRASRDTLLALTKGITAFRVEELRDGRGDVSAVWFEADQLYNITVDIVGLAFRFEVFTLVVRTPAEMLAIARANMPQMESSRAEMKQAGLSIPQTAPPATPAPTGEFEQWPFQSWRLDVLQSMEFIVEPKFLPKTAYAVREYLLGLPAGVAPAGSEHTCLTASGLLFSSDDGKRFLVVADGMPGMMRVTDEEDVVQSYLRQCIAVPASDYAARL